LASAATTSAAFLAPATVTGESQSWHTVAALKSAEIALWCDEHGNNFSVF
jgi:hypothetical protein